MARLGGSGPSEGGGVWSFGLPDLPARGESVPCFPIDLTPRVKQYRCQRRIRDNCFWMRVLHRAQDLQSRQNGPLVTHRANLASLLPICRPSFTPVGEDTHPRRPGCVAGLRESCDHLCDVKQANKTGGPQAARSHRCCGLFSGRVLPCPLAPYSPSLLVP